MKKVKSTTKYYFPRMITFTCFDKINGAFLCSLTVPYDVRTVDDYEKVIRSGSAYHISEDEIIIRKTRRHNGIGDRAILRMASGMILNYPVYATEYDFKIILAQLSVVEMRFTHHAGNQKENGLKEEETWNEKHNQIIEERKRHPENFSGYDEPPHELLKGK